MDLKGMLGNINVASELKKLGSNPAAKAAVEKVVDSAVDAAAEKAKQLAKGKAYSVLTEQNKKQAKDAGKNLLNGLLK